MRLRYFAWLRSRIGTGSEEVALPDTVHDVSGLLDWLRQRGANYQAALADPETVRVAVNHEYADRAHPVTDSDEVALFPPVTGG
jgi:molybdopterin synthase sulfur carrier subunit